MFLRSRRSAFLTEYSAPQSSVSRFAHIDDFDSVNSVRPIKLLLHQRPRPLPRTLGVVHIALLRIGVAVKVEGYNYLRKGCARVPVARVVPMRLERTAFQRNEYPGPDVLDGKK